MKKPLLTMLAARLALGERRVAAAPAALDVFGPAGLAGERQRLTDDHHFAQLRQRAAHLAHHR
jgi:hypothetical protein